MPTRWLVLFITPEVLYTISMHTNTYAIYYDSVWSDSWVRLTPCELQTWLSIHIFLTINPEPCQQDYWCSNPLKGPIYPIIINAMSRNRWQAIAGALHISDPALPTATIYGKMGGKEGIAYLF